MKTLRLIPAALILLTPLFALGDTTSWHRMVGILQYLETDYPFAIETQLEIELEEQRTFIADALEIATELGEPAAPFLPTLQWLQEQILAEADPDVVSARCGELIQEIVEAQGLEQSPATSPSLERGGELYAQQCAVCHGADGGADVPELADMDPPPANFLDDDVMDSLSPYKAFNTIRFGITGTDMIGFSHLDEDDQWALAFFLYTLRQPACEGEPPAVSLQDLATHTDEELAQIHGEDALACLRGNLPEVDEEDLLLFAKDGVLRALAMADEDPRGARRELLDAYLLGIEPAEPRIRARDSRLVLDIETQFLVLRAAIEQGRDNVAQEGEKLLALIDEGREAATDVTAVAIFWVALAIILREGFEAILVIGALLTVLKKMGETRQAKIVHLGWISALLLGGVAFAFGQRLLAGANREWLEGIAALLAVAMLLYHITWMSARSNVAAYMKEVRGKMEGAVGRGSVMGLFFIAFLAAFRESFETVLFMQGLSIDSPEGVIWGSLAGLVGLLILVFVIFRLGVKLPLPALFRWSSILLFVTALFLLGKGLRAIQEVGAIPLSPIPGPTFDLIGIYPDLYTLVPQFLLLLSPIAWKRYKRSMEEKKASSTESGLSGG